MTESRAARQDELGGMLELMCEAFDLPIDPARSIFYADPYFDPERKRVLLVNGEIVSCLTIVEAPFRVGSGLVRAAGIAGLATLARHRGKGYASQLLRETLEHLEGAGYGFCGLFAANPALYERLGFRAIGRQASLQAPASCYACLALPPGVRTCLPSDLESMAAIHHRGLGSRQGSLVRDSRRWRYLLDHASIALAYAPDGIEAYAFAETQPDSEGGCVVRVLELQPAQSPGGSALLAALASADGATALELQGPKISELWPLVPPSAQPGQIRTQAADGPMFRVVGFAKAVREVLTGLAAPREPVLLRCALEDGVVQETCLSASGGQEASRAVASFRGQRQVVTAGPGDWARVLLGGCSGEEVLASGTLAANSHEAASHMKSLFGGGGFWIPPADRF